MTERNTSTEGSDEKPFEHQACRGCAQSHACREVWASPNKGPFSAGGLIAAATTAFLLPCLTAIIAAAWAQTHYAVGSSDSSVMIAAGAGLAVGTIIAALIVPFLRRKFPASRTCDSAKSESPLEC